MSKFYDENRLTMNTDTGRVIVQRTGCEKCPHCNHTVLVSFEAESAPAVQQELTGDVAGVVWDVMKSAARRNSPPGWPL